MRNVRAWLAALVIAAALSGILAVNKGYAPGLDFSDARNSQYRPAR
jgi:hypothetical protein